MSRSLPIAAFLLAIATSSAAQTLPRVAIISPITEAGGATRLGALKDGLRDNGLIEGKHYVLDARYADGQADRFPALVLEVVQRNPAVIIVVHVASVRAAQPSLSIFTAACFMGNLVVVTTWTSSTTFFSRGAGMTNYSDP